MKHSPERFAPNVRLSRYALVIVCLFAGLTTSMFGQARGVLITKPSNAHPDGSAKVIEFRSRVKMGAITRYFLTDGRKVDFDFQAVQDFAMFPDLSQPILDARQLGPLEANIREYQQLRNKYPQSANVMDAQTRIARDMIQKVKDGNVLLNGQWITRAEYDALLGEQTDKLKKQHEMSVERRKLMEEDREKLEIEARRKKT